MPFYLVQGAYSGDAVKGLLANPHDRQDTVRNMVEALGGRLHHLFFAFGEYDFVALIEAPDNVSMAAISMIPTGAGTGSVGKTTVLLTMDEAVAAMQKAGAAVGSYTPPGG